MLTRLLSFSFNYSSINMIESPIVNCFGKSESKPWTVFPEVISFPRPYSIGCSRRTGGGEDRGSGLSREEGF